MFEKVYFCGFRVWKVAIVVALIGSLNSLFTFMSMLICWFYAPLSVAVFFAYISVLIGIKFRSVGYLRFGEIILFINAVIHVLLEVAALAIEIFVPNDEIIDSVKPYDNDWIEQHLHITFTIIELIILLQVAFTVFSFIAVHKTRLYFTFIYPYGYFTSPKRQISHTCNDSPTPSCKRSAFN